MEEYKRIYDIYIHKSDDELREIINPKNGYSRTAIEVAWDILCYERKVEDLGYEDFEDLLKHHGMSLEEDVGILSGLFSKESQTAEIFQKAGIVILSVVLYPLGMFFLWKNKKFDKQFKIIESVCCFGLWVLLSVFVAGKINNIAEFWKAGSDNGNGFVGNLEIKDGDGKIWITTDDLKSIEVLPDPDEYSGEYTIEMVLTEEGAEKFENVTSENIGNILPIYVNGECVSYPTVTGCITNGRAQVSGISSLSEAKEIVNTIKNVEDNRDVVVQKSEKKDTEKPKETTEPIKTEKPKATEMPKDEVPRIEDETSTPEPDGVSEEEPQEENDVATATERQVSKLLFDGTNIIDETISFMKQYDYVSDIAIEVDESSEEIDIVVQASSSIDIETAKMAGEDAARYLAFCASMANSYYSAPGSTDIGGIYKTYDLLLYVDDGLKTFDIYGAKVRTANSITWR